MAQAGEQDVAGIAVQRCGSLGGAGLQRRCRKRLEAQGGQRAGAVKPMLRFGIGVNEPAIGQKGRHWLGVLIEEPLHALGERQRRARRLGGDDEHRPSAVAGHNSRTGTGQRAADAAAETAQAFQALLPAGRQGCRQAQDLRGGKFGDGKTPVGAGV